MSGDSKVRPVGPGVALALPLALAVLVAGVVAWLVGSATGSAVAACALIGVVVLVAGSSFDSWREGRRERR